MLVKDGIENDAADAGLENMVLAEDCPLLNPPILAELIKDVGAAAAVLAGANEKGDGVVAGALVPKDVPKRPGVAAGAGEVAPNGEGAGAAPNPNDEVEGCVAPIVPNADGALAKDDVGLVVVVPNKDG